MSQRSLKKVLAAKATGGRILASATSAPKVRALSSLTAALQSGDRVGLIGPNGAGKTTLLRTLAGIYEPTHGQVSIEGRVVPMLETTAGFNMEMSGSENIRLRCMYMGLRPTEVRELAPDIEAFTELGGFLDMPLKTYSAGMLLRLSFAIATSMKPDILLMDEWILVGDSAFLSKAERRLAEFVTKSSILVLAAHSDTIIRQWCNKAMFLSAGELRYFGDTESALEAYSASQALS